MINQRSPRLLWACPYCLLDTSSGASIAIKNLLLELLHLGWDIHVLCMSIFDTFSGTILLQKYWDIFQKNTGKIVVVNEGMLKHHIIPVKSTQRFDLTTRDEDIFLSTYVHTLDKFKPDLVLTYGGHCLDFCIADEAYDRNVPIVYYLGNSSYQTTRWCRDIDLIVTDSKATSAMYIKKQGFHPVPIGVAINPAHKLAPKHYRKNVLFVNPSLAKGVGIVITLALMLEEKRPDIFFEIQESRGTWAQMLKAVSKALGHERNSLRNVVVSPHSLDMRPVFGRARILLAPSLWWESFGMVAAEAMINGIPAIVSNRGGLPEAIGTGGLQVAFPSDCYESPYVKIPQAEALKPIADAIERFYDDEAFYKNYCHKARFEGKRYSVGSTAKRFITAVQPLLKKRAGDRDINGARLRPNRQLAV